MKKIYEGFYQVWLLNKENNFYELLLKRENENSILIVMISGDVIFDYRPCYNYCYANKEVYDEHIAKAIEVLKNE